MGSVPHTSHASHTPTRVQVLKLIQVVPRSTTSWEAFLTPLWWSIAPNRLKSPVFAPAALRGTRFGLESRAVGRNFFLPKVVVFGVRRGTISSSTCRVRTARRRRGGCARAGRAHSSSFFVISNMPMTRQLFSVPSPPSPGLWPRTTPALQRAT